MQYTSTISASIALILGQIPLQSLYHGKLNPVCFVITADATEPGDFPTGLKY